MATALELNHISAGYNGSDVLRRISLSIEEGQFLGILGSNGSGKSTLLRVMGGLLRASNGQVLLQGNLLSALSRREVARQVAFLPQQSMTDFDLTVREMVMLGRSPHIGAMNRMSRHDIASIEKALEEVDLLRLADRSLLTLSGGEKQRVILARALAQEPRILLLDEPTSYLDLAHQVEFFELLKELHRTQRMTIICVSHDVNLCANYVDRVAFLRQGELFATGTPEEMIHKDVLEKVFDTSFAYH